MPESINFSLEEFAEKARGVAEYYLKRYPSLRGCIEAEDLVQDSVLKILVYNNRYDPEKSAFSSFVYMIVSSVAKDILKSRFFNNFLNTDYFERAVKIDNYDEDFTLGDVVGLCGCSEAMEDKIIEKISYDEIMDKLPTDSSRVARTPYGVINMSPRNVIELKMAGYSNKEICSWFDTKSITPVLRRSREALALA